MNEAAISLEPADDGTLPYVTTLLEKNGLPSRDVRTKPDRFYIGCAGGDPVGIGRIERHGTNGLLRSVVIEQSARGNGFGAAICEALETEARADGVETLYLLTTTVPAFFSNRGYVEIERTDAPTSIQQTTEFEDLCPTTTAGMKKRSCGVDCW